MTPLPVLTEDKVRELRDLGYARICQPERDLVVALADHWLRTQAGRQLPGPPADDRQPTARGAKRCLEWLAACKQIGWSKDSMGALSNIFWHYHDDNGDLRNFAPPQEPA